MANVFAINLPHNDTLISGLLDDYGWGSGSGPTQITYSFPSGGDTTWPDLYGSEINSFSALTSSEQQQVNLAFDLWESVANISFTKVADSGSTMGDIRVSHSDIIDDDGSTVAWAYLPSPLFFNGTEASDASGDTWLNNYNYADGPGSFNFLTLIHEIGHAIGLTHPHDGRVIMATDFDSTQYSIMSYNDHADSFYGSYPSSPMLLDITAIQHIYGANTTYNTGDNTYQFDSNGEMLTIWDADGYDTFDFSNQSHAISMSLEEGSYTSVGYLDNVATRATDNIAIAYDVVIEAVIGSDFSDNLTGNSADNSFTAGLGDDIIDGGAGGDILILDSNYAAATITFTDFGIDVSSAQGVDSLHSVEAIQFNDGIVSLLSESLPATIVDEESVGRVLSLYQAGLNREPDIGGLNFWVNDYIQGSSFVDIAQNFVDSVEFASTFSINSNEDYIATLYQNVLGREGEAGGVAFWLAGLDGGESYAKVLLSFSDSAENQSQVAPLLAELTYQPSDALWVLA